MSTAGSLPVHRQAMNIKRKSSRQAASDSEQFEMWHFHKMLFFMFYDHNWRFELLPHSKEVSGLMVFFLFFFAFA